jgi:CRP/FNR family transcriptional regulator, anaerobic regulatory protein
MNAAVQNIVVLKSPARQEGVSACLTCSKRAQCPAASVASGQPAQRIVQSGKAVYEAGERFEGIYIVRSGFFKSYSIDADGVMQVTGFHLPGDFIGMDGIESGHYGDNVEALDTSSVCKLPLSMFSEAPSDASAPDGHGTLMLKLVKLLSRTISGDRRMFFTLGKMSARRRMGVFLKELSERMAQSGYSASEFTLCMSRTDIANYLCLALETVSRLVTQLQTEGTIAIDRRHIRLLDMHALVRDDGGVERMRKAG